MIVVDCSQLSTDEKLSLASQISDKLEGIAIALVNDENIVMDELSSKKLEPSTVKEIVGGFASRAKDAKHYSVELVGERIILHCSTPTTARRKTQNQLPPNIKQCPYCAFVSPYEEEYTVHVRAHLVGVV